MTPNLPELNDIDILPIELDEDILEYYEEILHITQVEDYYD